MNKFFKFLFSRELITYLIAGVLTTLVNLLVFAFLSRFLGTSLWWVSNFPAIVAAILFAFWANRVFVFRSHGSVWQELSRFLASRIFTALAFEYGAMFLLTNVMGIDAVISFAGWEMMISKLLTQILVMVGNYIFSKLFVFNRQEKKHGKNNEYKTD